MKKLLILSILFITTSSYVSAEKKCSDLPGFEKIGKDTAEYLECVNKKASLKLNTESKLTDVVSGKEKLKLPNPINGLKAIGRALKYSPVEKK
ncbi:hypothetical protein OAA82_01335 [Pelagibacteraceae bacterium]|nr:hypothetical protein [Pelagibacteraceae bacterium]